MRRNQRSSPLPPASAGGKNVTRPAPAGTAAPAAPGNGHATVADYAPESTAAVALRGSAAQIAATLVMLTGLWVAISPWFLTLQVPPAANATVNDLIIGLAVAVFAMLAAGRPRSMPGLPAASLLAGIWLIISPFVLAAQFSVTASMYWSNIWAGAVVIVASLAVLATGPARAAR